MAFDTNLSISANKYFSRKTFSLTPTSRTLSLCTLLLIFGCFARFGIDSAIVWCIDRSDLRIIRLKKLGESFKEFFIDLHVLGFQFVGPGDLFEHQGEFNSLEQTGDEDHY